MTVFAGQGDPRRSMALLWLPPGPADRPRTGPGPKPALSVGAVVDAGIAVADEQGMAALSMRAVGERLGRTAMALYTYVPGKGELLDLMHDRVLAELLADLSAEPGPTAEPAPAEPEPGTAVGRGLPPHPAGPSWRADVTRWAERCWAFHLRHPWVLLISQARPVLGPNEYAVVEALLRALAGTGLGAGVLRRAAGVLVNHVRGSAQAVAESRQAAAATGVSDEQWWFARASLLPELAPDFAERYPLLTAVEQDRAADFGPPDRGADGEPVPYLEGEAAATFRAGLVLLLDGLAAAVAAAGPDPAARPD
ncbi:TetR/AcrR family transcriptional regulator [Kitasatospora sp. NPDC048540]|uniref:TetR/AcrR family transcriptional regulator n=1 Tax=unclassified Kitasatospora TaxID=2633591 RepID=UPI000539BB52|nr:TetR/AcrR family transcriptional regulator [Kitasatospora sp. MBT63]